MNRTALALKMLIYLKGNGLTKKFELADYLETNVRNIKELRSELEVAGYTIDVINGPHGGYLLRDTSFFPLSFLEPHQRQALIDASPYLLSANQPTLGKDFKEGFLKLVANEKVYTTIQSETHHLQMSSQQIEHYLQLLREAINKEQRVLIVYQRDLLNSKNYLFEPYEVLLVNGLWYVVGYIKNDHWASLKINRFKDIKSVDESYLKDETFSTQSMLSEFGFKFNDIVALDCIITNHAYVTETVYGKNQNITILDEVSLRLEVEIDSRLRAQQFILQFGSDIKIIEPKWLNTYQKEQARKILDLK